MRSKEKSRRKEQFWYNLGVTSKCEKAKPLDISMEWPKHLKEEETV